jgi:hypothetical protein
MWLVLAVDSLMLPLS